MHAVPEMEEFKYLGSAIGSDGKSEKEVKKRIQLNGALGRR